MKTEQTNKTEWQAPRVTELEITTSTSQLPPPDEPQQS